MTVHNQWQTTRAVKGGLVAGLVAGLVLTVILALMNYAAGRDVWQAMKFAAVPFLGERALAPGPDAVAVALGLFSHFLVSVVWGIVFGLLFFGLGAVATVLAGILWGVVVWIGMLYVVMPILGFPAGGTAPLGVSLFTHVLFGVVLAATFLPYQREIPPVSRARPSV